MRLWRLLAAFPDGERRRLLAERGRYSPGASEAEVLDALERLIASDPAAFVASLAHSDADLLRLWPHVAARDAFHQSGARDARYPGRGEALLALARALSVPLPASEYALPEARLDALLERARSAHGRRLPLSGAPGHKGRVGDAVERLLVGGKIAGKRSDHPEAEIKSVPVRGAQVIERVKLGVVSPTSNPLDKCSRLLFVFVEQRGEDHFVRGHRFVELDPARFRSMWRDGWLVETAAGSPRFPARGLYLVPRWFRREGLWPS